MLAYLEKILFGGDKGFMNISPPHPAGAFPAAPFGAAMQNLPSLMLLGSLLVSG